MRRLRRAGGGAVEFVVGDDWRMALGVAGGLGVTAALSSADVASWWVLPVAVCCLLGVSLWRSAARAASLARSAPTAAARRDPGPA